MLPAVNAGTTPASWCRTGFGAHGNPAGWERSVFAAVVCTVLPTQAAGKY